MRIKLVSIAMLLIATVAVGLFVMPTTDGRSATEAAASTEIQPAASQAYLCAGTADERIAALEKKLVALEEKVGKTIPVVAVADLEVLVNDCVLMKEIRADLIKKRDDGKARIELLKARYDKDVAQQKLTKENSEAWWNWEKKIRPLKYEIEVATRTLAEELMFGEMKGVEKVYEHVRAAIKEVAQVKGYTVVLWNPPAITKETWEMARSRGNLFQHRYMIDVRPLLYCDEKVVDITADVIKIFEKK